MADARDILVEADMALRLRSALDVYGDDELTLDMIEGETSLFELIDQLMEERAADLAMANALGAQMQDMRDRQGRFKRRADARKGIVQKALEHADIRSLERPAFTASLSASKPSVNITDESALPDNLVRVKREPNKVAIAKALSAGDAVLGAHLSNGGQTLTVRTK